MRFLFLTLSVLLGLTVVGKLLADTEDVLSGWTAWVALGGEILRDLPLALRFMLPMTTLLAPMFTYNSFLRSGEWFAMQSVGMRPRDRLGPFLLGMALISALGYFNRSYLERWAVESSASTAAFPHRWYLLEESVLYIGPAKRTQGSPSAWSFSWQRPQEDAAAVQQPWRIERIERIPLALRKEEDWLLPQLFVYARKGLRWRTEAPRTERRPLERLPTAEPKAPDPGNWPFFVLLRQLRGQIPSTLPRQRIALALQRQIASFFTPFCLTLFAFSLIRMRPRSRRPAGEMMFAILGGTVYALSEHILTVLGDAQRISEWISAWSLNGMFLLLALLLHLRKVG